VFNLFKTKQEKNEKDREAKITAALNDINSKSKDFIEKRSGEKAREKE